MDRDIDLRDSTVQNRENMTRKRRVQIPAAQSQLSRTHCTPWGEPVGEEELTPNRAQEPTLRSNHFQNNESPLQAGTYRVPDPSPAHNHLQNQETEQKNGKMKLSTSKINDGEELFSPPARSSAGTGPQSPVVKGKVAPGTSRINAGNDIFGPPIEPANAPPPRTEPFLQRSSSGHIKGSHWLGYTSLSS